MNETIKMSEAWRALAERFRKLAEMRADEGTSIQLAYLVLAQHCTRQCSDNDGGPTMEMVALAEITAGENLQDEFTKKAMGVAETTTVDIVIRLQVAGSSADVETYREALQAHVSDITSTRVQGILIESCDELAKGET